MDAFFAAIEVRDRPELRGKAVIVGGRPGEPRSVVSTASYEARRYGVHSAMPLATAIRLCPHGVFLPVDMARYAAVSHELFQILQQFTPVIEPVSIDEAFLDLSHAVRDFAQAEVLGRTIKET
ncbi:MAG: DNA polymerase IV, partial [Bacteroidota bacterium]